MYVGIAQGLPMLCAAELHPRAYRHLLPFIPQLLNCWLLQQEL
jgi:hypothetical protein